jgi:hypothetical protein
VATAATPGAGTADAVGAAVAAAADAAVAAGAAGAAATVDAVVAEALEPQVTAGRVETTAQLVRAVRTARAIARQTERR